MSFEHSYLIDNFEKQSKLGEGSFGEVYKVINKENGNICAAKISLKELNENSTREMINFSREVNINAKLNHPSILKFIGYSPINFEKEPKPVIISEFSVNGSLGRIIELERMNCAITGWDDTKKLINIYGIASGMSYLHTHNIIHRDLKPENILLDDYLLPKIADFGLSKIDHKNQESMTMASTVGIKGTPIYIAPEIWKNEEYKSSCDVYAFGFIVYEIVTNEIPMKELHSYYEILHKVATEEYRPKFPFPIPKAYEELIEKCWAQDPQKRPTFNEIVDELKNNTGFITENVDENDYYNYIDYVEKYQATFDSNKNVVNFSDFFNCNSKTIQIVKVDRELIKIIEQEDFDSPLLTKIQEQELYPSEQLQKLDQECQELVKIAEKDPEKRFLVGKKVFEGVDKFPQNTEIGIRYLKKAISEGSVESTIYYSRLLIEGKLIPRDLSKANKFLQKYSEAKNPSIDYLFGRIHMKEKNYDKALSYFKNSSKRGNEEAMLELGKMLFKGKGTEKNEKEAKNYFQMAKRNGLDRSDFYIEMIDNPIKILAEKGDINAAYEYAVMLDQGKGVKVNKIEACKYYKMAADNGNIDAMCAYGLKLNKGDGVEFNEEKAFDYIEKAAKGGNVEAMYYYALELDDCTFENEIEACKYYKKAADSGIVQAMIKYAHKLEKNCINKDKKEPYKYYKNAAKEGNVDAMIICGIMLSSGDGVQIDKEKAYQYFKMAADKGSPFGMNRCGWNLLKGEGVEVNIIESLKYFRMSAEHGNTTGEDQYWYQLNKYRKQNQNSIQEEDEEESFKYLKNSIEKKNSIAMRHYAEYLYESNSKENKIKSIEYFKRSADQLNIESMVFYSEILMKGEITEKNEKESLKYLEIAKDFRHKKAMKILGNYLLNKDSSSLEEKEQANEYLKMAEEINEVDCLSVHKLELYNQLDIYSDDMKSIKYLQKCLVKDDANMIYNYALRLDSGDGVIEDQKKACELYKEAANRGNTYAMCRYAFHLYIGTGVKEDKIQSANYYKMAADNGDIDSMIQYGMILESGDGVEKDIITAYQYFKMAADKGNAFAMNRCALNLLKGEGIEINEKESIKYFKMSAERGNRIGEDQYWYQLNKLKKYFAIPNQIKPQVDEDEEESFKYLKNSIEKKNSIAMRHYAEYLYESNSKENKIKSIEYFKRSADQLNIESMVFYSEILMKGEITEKNEKESLKYLEMAKLFCGEKIFSIKLHSNIYLDEKDYFRIGMEYYAGIDVNVDKKLASLYFKYSADFNYVDAMIFYATMLNSGDGIPIDKNESKNYFTKAAKISDSAKNLYAWKLMNGELGYFDISQAEFYFSQSASSYNHEALTYMGCKNALQNNKKALKYFKRAADKGNVTSMYYCGLLLSISEKEEDHKSASNYFKMAAHKCHSKSMYKYAHMLQKGKGVIKDEKEAVKYFKKAAENGHYESMVIYAKELEKGELIKAEKDKALKYYHMAALNNNVDAINHYLKFYFDGYQSDFNKDEIERFVNVLADNKDYEALNKFNKLHGQNKINEITSKDESNKQAQEQKDDKADDEIKEKSEFTYKNEEKEDIGNEVAEKKVSKAEINRKDDDEKDKNTNDLNSKDKTVQILINRIRFLENRLSKFENISLFDLELLSNDGNRSKNDEVNDLLTTYDDKITPENDDQPTTKINKIIDERNHCLMLKQVINIKEQQKYPFNNTQDIKKELERIRSINHPSICRIIDIETQVLNESQIILYYEYLEYKLSDCLKNKILNNTLKIIIAIEVLFGMQHFHSLNIVYKNLCIENVMLNCVFEAKIINTLCKNVSDSIYIAPEVKSINEFNLKTDVYSYGVFLFVLFTGETPEHRIDCNEIIKLDQNPSISLLCIELIKKCIDVDQEKRPLFSEIIEKMENNSFALSNDFDLETISRRYKILKSLYLKK